MMPTRRDALTLLGSATIMGLGGCASHVLPEATKSGDAATGSLEFHEAGARSLFPRAQALEQLANGFTWSEGPSWDRDRECLYFTDVPANRAYRWSQTGGLETFLDPSGVDAARTAGLREPGANGLWFADDGWLYLCNHGERAVQRLRPETLERETLVSEFEGRRFNSPNDLIMSADRTIYFTDPPYGLEGLDASPLKELSANGVYRLTPDGNCERLFDHLSFPNGIALSPEEDWLYVAQSDPEMPIIYRAALQAGLPVGALEPWFNAAPLLAAGDPGLPDGMCVSDEGLVFATGPGGVLVISPEGVLLARILTGSATANCAFGGANGDWLYITAHDRLLRLRLNARGLQWKG